MQLERSDANSITGVTETLRVLRQVRWIEGVAPLQRLVVDRAIRDLRRLPRLPTRGRISIVVLGPDGTRLAVAVDKERAHIDFGRDVGDSHESLYELRTRPDYHADESGDFRNLAAMDPKWRKDWVTSVKIEYDE